jgi:galactokinase
MHEFAARAPGRVNLIGEHTDYHEGFVLPSAIPQQTTAIVRPRTDRRVHAVSAERPDDALTFELGEERRTTGWGDYIQGVTQVLAASGHRIGGFDLQIRSEVPVGSGLSSSAALEISVLRALAAAFDLSIDAVQMARIGQRAEVEFVGAPVGIMDQMASSLATDHDALFLDTRTLAFESIPLPATLALLVVDSGVTHQHAGGGYVTRRAESERAARLLGVRCLRDVDETALPRLTQLPPLEARRARHVITENARVLSAVSALRAGDLVRLGELFLASHQSMRDDYEISTPEIDLLVGIAQEIPGAYGARLTGGGFGGAIVVAADADEVGRVAAHLTRIYAQRSGRSARVLVPPDSVTA